MAKSEIFRKVSLERLSSPEQLDQLMQVTTPKGWVALGIMGCLLALALVWSVVGSIPERVVGQGILLRSGGVYEVISPSGGRVTDLSVRAGDRIREGEVVARLSQPELLEQLRQARDRVAELRGRHEELEQLVRDELALQAQYAAQRRDNVQRSIDASGVTLDALRERIEAQRGLVAEGLLTREVLLTTRQDYEQVKERIRADSSVLAEVRVEMLRTRTAARDRLQASVAEVKEAERELELVRQDVHLKSEVVSRHTGRVLEVLAEQGGIVERGSRVLTVSRDGRAVKALEAVIYVPSEHGKRIRPRMEIQISPATVKKEEFGYLVGRVTYVSDFPATREGMARVLKNAQLVEALSEQKAPYEVHADLIPDPSAASGYRWSSSSGPPLQIQSGTLAEGDIIVRRRKPILLVVPQLGQVGAGGE